MSQPAGALIKISEIMQRIAIKYREYFENFHFSHRMSNISEISREIHCAVHNDAGADVNANCDGNSHNADAAALLYKI